MNNSVGYVFYLVLGGVEIADEDTPTLSRDALLDGKWETFQSPTRSPATPLVRFGGCLNALHVSKWTFVPPKASSAMCFHMLDSSHF